MVPNKQSHVVVVFDVVLLLVAINVGQTLWRLI